MCQPVPGSGSGSELHHAPHASHEAADAKSNGQKQTIDAGLRSLDHYKRALPPWRYNLRQKMLPIVRWETPYLARLQDAMRTPALDSYFAITANLGTHTFFMIGLPMLFWFGYLSFGKGLVHILAEGVFFTGFIKDFFSLPRPLSPPLNRITMSGSAALEYGFPSTHSANAISVAVYALLCLRSGDNTFAPTTKLMLEMLGYFYAASIVFGRLYCGMHGFLDVIVGSVLGAAISVIEFYYGPPLHTYMHESGLMAPLIAAAIIIILVRVHPEPADDCPCFDDSVAFAGVMIGLEIGTWHGRTSSRLHPFPYAEIGWPLLIGRIVFGVLTIVAWREIMKPTLLKSLPYAFRVIERFGVSLPRRFFVPASEYKNIPNLLKLRTDNVLPTMSDLPNFVKTLRAPARGRSVSIGPQSAADAYETLAYRERRRRESGGSNGSSKSKSSLFDLREKFKADGVALGGDQTSSSSVASGFQPSSINQKENMMGQGRVIITGPDSPRTPHSEKENIMEQGRIIVTGPDSVPSSPSSPKEEPAIIVVQQDELGEREMFEKLIKPRVRYDVEVVTKLVVYTGIAWLAVELIPALFELVGLGILHLRT